MASRPRRSWAGHSFGFCEITTSGISKDRNWEIRRRGAPLPNSFAKQLLLCLYNPSPKDTIQFQSLGRVDTEG